MSDPEASGSVKTLIKRVGSECYLLNIERNFLDGLANAAQSAPRSYHSSGENYMNPNYITIQDHLDDIEQTLPVEWDRLEHEWAAMIKNELTDDYVIQDYGKWRLNELICAFREGDVNKERIVSIASAMVAENEILLMILDVLNALRPNLSSLDLSTAGLLRIARHSKHLDKIPPIHVMRFARHAAEFLDVRLSTGELTVEETRRDVLARRSFTQMVTDVVWAADHSRCAA